MVTSAQVEGSHGEPLLPPGLVWVYVVAPIGLALMMSNNIASVPAGELLRRIAAEYIPFLLLASAFHLLYRDVMPGLLRRVRSVPGRIATHVVAVVGVSAVVAVPAHPLLEAAKGCQVPFGQFAATAVLISACCLFPALWVQRLRVRAIAAERTALAERQAALQAQLDALQSRTNPHFLFNSLNTVAALIPENPAQAEQAVEQLSDLLRYGLEASRLRTVPLRRELKMIHDYLQLQAARFGSRLRTRLDVDDALVDEPIPPLLVQPLVENAIVHGSGRRGGCEVSVRVFREGDRMLVEVEDDGPGPGASAHTGTGSAVAAIAERVRLHYATGGEFSLLPRPQGGCLARLTLPLSEAG